MFHSGCEITNILHQALRIEFWGYTNQVRLRGLTLSSKVLKPAQAGFVCVVAVLTAQLTLS
jgi:hypothetical protein